jgi:tRNA (mo5U34)-methyltransferase
MTRDEILKRIDSLKPWFHRIDLGDGIVTKTESTAGEPPDHPLGTWEIIRECLPADLSGRDVLDVGCNAGFYSIEAKRRGARRVLGVDARRSHVRQALFVKNVLGLDIEYRRLSAYDLDPHDIGQFDITLALGLIYHCKHPMLALENLARVTKDILILETATLPTAMLPDSVQHNIGDTSCELYPMAYIENRSTAEEASYNWFLPGVEGLRAMLREVGFTDVDPFHVREERAVLVCRKDRIALDSLNSTELAADLEILDRPNECRPGDVLNFRVAAKNTGLARWSASGEPGTERGAVRLVAHILFENGEDSHWYRAGCILPKDVAPGETIVLDFTGRAPEQTGNYLLEFDVVAEYVTWFEDVGSKVVHRPLRVI